MSMLYVHSVQEKVLMKTPNHALTVVSNFVFANLANISLNLCNDSDQTLFQCINVRQERC